MTAQNYPATARPEATPWGHADFAEEYAPGIWRVGTPSHGGIHLSAERQAQMPDYMRNPAGWYEEDIGWSKVAVVFPDVFKGDAGRQALDTLRHYYPDAFERFTGKALNPGESRKRDEELFWAAHPDSLVVVSAFGDQFAWVPEGKVGVVARRGKPGTPAYARSAEAWFLVDAAEYKPGNFVIVPARHEATDAPANPLARR